MVEIKRGFPLNPQKVEVFAEGSTPTKVAAFQHSMTASASCPSIAGKCKREAPCELRHPVPRKVLSLTLGSGGSGGVWVKVNDSQHTRHGRYGFMIARHGREFGGAQYLPLQTAPADCGEVFLDSHVLHPNLG